MSKLQSRLNSFSTILLICDMQVRFAPLIYRSSTVTNRIALLNNVANVIKIPVIVTEQYPKAFGATIKVLIVEWQKPAVIMVTIKWFLMSKIDRNNIGSNKDNNISKNVNNDNDNNEW